MCYYLKKTTINIKKENIISAGRGFVKPIGINFWTTYLEIQDFQNKTDLYYFLHFVRKQIENI